MKKLLFLLFVLTSFQVNAQKNASYKKLDNYFSQLDAHNRFMGNVLIMKGDKVVYQNEIGFSDKEKNKKHNAGSIFRVGSITKTYTATLVLKLVEEGKLSLDDKLSKYFSDIKNADKITIKQMLNHSSGLANYTNQADFGKYLSQAQSQDQMLERIAKLESDFEPGSKHEYSNTNFMLLGFIVKKVSGKAYSQLLQEYILSPLKLKNTHYQLGDKKIESESKSYVRQEEWEVMPSWNLDVAAAAGAMRATSKDLGLFAHNLFQGKILTASSLTVMTTFEERYGLGLLKAPFFDKELLMHGGKIEGFTSRYFHNKEDDVTFVILCNGNNFPMNDISIAMASAFYGKDFSIPNMEEKKEIEISVEQLHKYEGEFASDSFPLGIKIFMEGNKLFAQATGQGAFPLKAIGDNEFEFKSANIKMNFIKLDNGYSQMKFAQGGLNVLFKKK